SQAVLEQKPVIVEQKIATATLVQDGRFYYEMGKMDEAESRLKQAIKQDPENQAAFFYLNLINENRFKEALNEREVASRKRLVDVGSTIIKIDPGLADVRLADLLDAIIKVADKPIRYSVEDYAVVFSLKAREAVPLFTKSFKVDPNTFYQGLESVIGLPFANI